MSCLINTKNSGLERARRVDSDMWDLAIVIKVVKMRDSAIVKQVMKMSEFLIQ